MATKRDDIRRLKDPVRAARSRMRAPQRDSLQFGQLTLDLEQQTVIHAGQVRYVRADYWKVLRLLIERKGKVVEKLELHNALGCSTDGSFTKHIQRIREIVGDTKKPYRLIAAERSVGYRWIGRQDAAGKEVHPSMYRHPNGRFERHGDTWMEYRNDAPAHPFVFKQLRQDEEYIYLFDHSRALDPGRPLYFRIPVAGGIAQWTYPNPLQWEDVMVVEPD